MNAPLSSSALNPGLGSLISPSNLVPGAFIAPVHPYPVPGASLVPGPGPPVVPELWTLAPQLAGAPVIFPRQSDLIHPATSIPNLEQTVHIVGDIHQVPDGSVHPTHVAPEPLDRPQLDPWSSELSLNSSGSLHNPTGNQSETGDNQLQVLSRRSRISPDPTRRSRISPDPTSRSRISLDPEDDLTDLEDELPDLEDELPDRSTAAGGGSLDCRVCSRQFLFI